VTTGRLFVVGAGQAGAQLVGSVRELGWTGPITLVGQETHPPYARPPLSKAYLRGEAGIASLALRSEVYYRDRDVEVARGQRIERLDLSVSGAGTATAASGRRWHFDRLVLATGAQPRRLPVPGAELNGVVMLGDVGDADLLARRLASARNLVVIGGGFVGLEVAATAAAMGAAVTVVEAAPSLLTRMVSAHIAAAVQAAHEETGTRPLRFHGDAHGAVAAVELTDGAILPTGLVLVGIGAVPRDDLARAAGLHCDRGVVVDRCSLTSDGHTVAIGDCANLPDPSPGSSGERLRLESVDNAVEQAKAAATTLIGDSRPYRSVPWFWSHQGDLKLQIAGLARADDDVVARHGKRAGQQIALRYRGERLVAAECLNAPGDFLALRMALAEDATLPREKATDINVPLKALLAVVCRLYGGR
jgi:3-phenylpropionate/trans-cinnamate dioxygenase ferredoxin reductase subunit